MFDPRLEKLKSQHSGTWTERICAELEYAFELSKVQGGAFDSLISESVAQLCQSADQQSAVTRQAVEQAEHSLSGLQAAAKQYEVVCAAHAHIDMNWMWRWDETVAITLDTFHTMLQLMREYPQFTFSQSQASVYRLVEQYAPDMLKEIRQRVQEGRWEVTAVTWVEADKNMISGESMARHLLYTRRYLKKLFDLPDAAFQMDFEPDTFGHSRNVAEILADAGVRYYYHCRGDQDALLYNWRAPSGRSILVYREPLWYLGYVDPGMARYVPSFCSQHGLNTMLRVYGVGDHGGGPTRRDVERLQDMDTWPIFPHFRMGTFADFFNKVEASFRQPGAPPLPVVDNELNFVFTGCYSSQSRIKKANRVAELELGEAELLSAWAARQDARPYPAELFQSSWLDTLFNQFHDIIPGSGTIDTREYALGLFQNTLAVTGSQKIRALRAIFGMQQHDPVPLASDAISEGAGVGFGVERFSATQVSRLGGMQRVFHVYNPAAWERHGQATLTLWDWDGSLERLEIRDVQDQILPHQLMERGWQNYWGHRYIRILVPVHVPAGGYTTLRLSESQQVSSHLAFPQDPRVETAPEFILENEHMLARFDPHSCDLVSLVDKASGETLVSPARPAGFRYILEDDHKGMTAWIVGRYMSRRPFGAQTRLTGYQNSGLRQQFSFEAVDGDTKLKVTISLLAGSRSLDFAVECDWLEVGKSGRGVPQLNYSLPLSFPCQSYRRDVPLGTADSQPQALDVPGLNFIFALREAHVDASSVMLVSQGSYGFRAEADSLALTLLRSSYDPDPYPELCRHQIHFNLVIVKANASNQALMRTAFACQRPLQAVSGINAQAGEESFFGVEAGALMVSGVKLPEENPSGSEWIVRLYETEGLSGKARLRFKWPVASAILVDTHEQAIPNAPAPTLAGSVVEFDLPASRVAALKITFAS